MIPVPVETNVRSVDDKSLGLFEELELSSDYYDFLPFAHDYSEDINQLLCSSYSRIKYYNIKSDRYVLQSITSVENKVLISAYKKHNYSRIYIYDLENSIYEGMIILDNKAHVGGISYDKDRHILYITGSNGEINSYDYNVINNLEKNCKYGYVIDFSDNVSLPNEKLLEIKINNNINIKNIDETAEASTLYYYNDRLYVGTFNPTDNGYLYSYKVDYDSVNKQINIIDEHTKKYRIGARIQGIALTSYMGKEYLVCTQSIGITKSVFLLYEMYEDGLVFLGRKYLDDIGLEGITIDDKGYIVGIFENNKRNAVVVNIGELIREVSDSWLDYIPGNGIAALIGGEVYKLTHK